MRTPSLPWSLRATLSLFLGTGLVMLALALPADRTLGAMLKSDGNLELAADYYTRWGLKHPTDFATRWEAAELMLATAQPQAAVRNFELIAADWPSDPQALERLVEIEDSRLDVGAARARLARLARVLPSDHKILRRLAGEQRQAGESEALIQTLKHLVALGGHAEETVELTDILLSRRRYAELGQLLQRELQQHPERSEIRQAAFDLQLRIGDLPGARRQLTLLEAADPSAFTARFDLAWELVERRQFSEAQALVRERLQRQPRSPELVHGAADLYGELAGRLAKNGQQRAAIAVARDRVALEPTRVAVRLDLASLYGTDADRMALRELEALLALHPDSGEAWRALADRRSWTGDGHGAVDADRKALALMGASPQLERALAEHLAGIGQTAEAIAIYRRRVAQDGLETDRRRLAEILYDDGQSQASGEESRHLVSGTAHIGDRWLLARALAQEDRCSEALIELRIVTVTDPANREAWKALARCALKTGAFEEGRQALDHVAPPNPSEDPR